MKNISKKQQEIYNFIISFTSEKGYPPSVREICAAVNLKSPSSAHSHIKVLRESGYILKEDNKTRALTPAGGPRMQSRIAIVGRVAAGQPVLAVENVEGYLSFDVPGAYQEYFALRVSGSSMINAGIHDGDFVIVREQPSASSGEIVVAMLEDEATVKRLMIKDSQVWLVPENDNYSPIDGTGCSIVGIVTALYRKY